MKIPTNLFIALAVFAGGQVVASENHAFNSVNLAVPDGNGSGVRDIETFSSAINQIGSIQVSLNITGDFNGDLYCYLSHGSALSVLLNRPGRTAADSFGYDDCGFQITLNDTASNGDIHNYQSVLTPLANTPLTGIWQPDGRTSNPLFTLDTDPRTAGLSQFNGLDADGTWTLYIADLSPGGTSVLNSWSLDISPVPEPSVVAFLVVGAVALAVRNRRGTEGNQSQGD